MAIKPKNIGLLALLGVLLIGVVLISGCMEHKPETPSSGSGNATGEAGSSATTQPTTGGAENATSSSVSGNATGGGGSSNNTATIK